MIHAIFVTTCIVSATFQSHERLPVEFIPNMTVDSLDYVALDIEDIDREIAGLPLRFAVPTFVSITPAAYGLWEELDGNKLRWTYRVTCDNAVSMNLGFKRYNMPQSGSMIVMNETADFQIRPFTSQDNKDHGELWTPIIPSNQAIIEIVVDRADKKHVSRNIELTSINSGYRRFGEGDNRGSSESCNIDVVCPQGDSWWDEIPSVGVYTLNGYLTCTGVMMNNTSQDQTPYFLTANHCGVTSGSDSSIVVYWNHHNTYCHSEVLPPWSTLEQTKTTSTFTSCI